MNTPISVETLRSLSMAGLARIALLVVVGSALLTLSAKTQVPMWPVPMTLQSLVVLLIGAAYGPVLGAATVVAYLAQGLAGLPVFAGAVAGPGYFSGPTAGFLVSFVPAAILAGWAAQRGSDPIRLVAGMVAAHLVILAIGFVWLAFFATTTGGAAGIGIAAAWARGIAPFLVGTLVKTALAIALVIAWRSVSASRL
jgi:biotin transport system substrate-specific component